jgi:hypothetical protein
LPEITDCIRITPNGVREVILFDGKEDAVSQIERILGVKSSK